MHYVYPVMYLDENETFNFTAEQCTSNATGMNLYDYISEIYNSDINSLELWWIVPVIVFMVLILNIYTIR